MGGVIISRDRLVSWPIWLVCVYGLALAVTATVGTASAPVPRAPAANLLDKPLGEDAFYMFSVARNIGTGHGITYGGVPTTGVQPLATFVYALPYWLASHAHLPPAMPLRLILVINVALLVLAGWLVQKLVSRWLSRNGVDRPERFGIAAMIVVANPVAFRLFGYGLETGLYLCAIVGLQLALENAAEPMTKRDRLIIGLLLGATILARLDFIIIGAAVLGRRLLSHRLGVREALSIAALAAVLVGPWLIYVYSVVGGIMPSSGAAEAGMARNAAEWLDRGWVMASAIVTSLPAVVYAPTTALVPILSLSVLVSAAVRWMAGPIRVMLRHSAIWLTGASALAVYYLLFSTAGHFYGRYLAPLWLFWIETLAAAVAFRLSRWSQPRATLVQHLAGVALVVLFAVQIGYTVHRGHASNTHVYSAFYIREHAAELGTVGAFQNGVIGYVNDERTVNLDGKLDQRALRARGHLECYLGERGVTTVIDWPGYISGGWIDPAFVRTHMREVGQVPGGASIIMAVDAAGTAPCR